MYKTQSGFLLAICFLFFLGLGKTGFSQPLTWEFQNIITDDQQSGANPDLVQDDLGNLHLTYWHAEEDRLVYGMRDRNTGNWTFEAVPDNGSFGYASSLAVDPDGNVHIAYHHSDAGSATLKYATKQSGNWTIEAAFGSEKIGTYGRDQLFPSYVQPSVDVFFQSNGRPAILFFNGRMDNFVACSPVDRTYGSYKMNMNLLLQQPGGSWFHDEFDAVPYTGPTTCITGTDRFGEFGQVFPRANDKYVAITNSLHNNQLLMFESNPGTLLSWDRHKIDSTKRLYTSVTASHFRESFAFIDGSISNDSILHLAYRVSHMYGNSLTFFSRQHMLYTRINLNQFGDSAYTPFHYSFLPISTYRSHISLSHVDDDELFISYFDNQQRNIVVEHSTDGGQNWVSDSLYQTITNSDLKSEIVGDSLHLLVYDSEKDILRLSSRSLSGSTWLHQDITRTEKRGQSLSSQIVRDGNDDHIYVAFTERMDDQIYFGERLQNNWTFSPVDEANQLAEEPSLIMNEQEEPCLTYVWQETQVLRFAHRSAGVWNYTNISDSVEARNVVMKGYGDSLFVCFYDIGNGSLKYARGTPTGAWQIETIDSSSLIVGQRPDLIIDEGGGLHISYVDAFFSTLRYAHRSASGNWSLENVTSPGQQNPTFSSIQLDSTGQAHIAFRDAGSDSILLAIDQLTGWEVERVVGETINLIGIPLRLILDSKDRPWILYNYSGVLNEVRLTRQNEAGQWFQVALSQNSAQIGNEFDFHLVEKDFYIVGKKNQVSNNGLGLLFAAGGVSTNIEPPTLATEFQLFPNPSQGQIRLKWNNPVPQPLSIGIYNLQGQQVHLLLQQQQLGAGPQEFQGDVSGLPQGMYLLQVESPQERFFLKWLLTK